MWFVSNATFTSFTSQQIDLSLTRMKLGNGFDARVKVLFCFLTFKTQSVSILVWTGSLVPLRPNSLESFCSSKCRSSTSFYPHSTLCSSLLCCLCLRWVGVRALFFFFCVCVFSFVYAREGTDCCAAPHLGQSSWRWSCTPLIGLIMIECRLHCSNRCRPSVRTWSADYFDVTFWLCGPFPPSLCI